MARKSKKVFEDLKVILDHIYWEVDSESVEDQIIDAQRLVDEGIKLG